MGSTPRGISASRGAAVLGLSEYQTPFEVWQRICEERHLGFNAERGYTLPEESDNAAIRWGLAFENAAIELAERAKGERILGRENFCGYDFEYNGAAALSDDDYPITCHIDGYYGRDGETISLRNGKVYSTATLHEGKTTNAMTFREKWGEPGTDHIPRQYQIQVQHQMLCTGAQEAIVSVLVFPETPDHFEKLGWGISVSPGGHPLLAKVFNNGEPLFPDTNFVTPVTWADTLFEMGYFHQYPVKANPEAQRLMVEKYAAFWHNHVLTGEPPELRTYEDVKRFFPEPKTTIVVPEYIERKLLEYKGITEETANAKKHKDRIKMIVTKYAAEHGGVIDDESKEAVIFRSTRGDKLGSWGKNKNGVLAFRA
ncbi:MAG: YqaJ viral recombinase family protein [Treponema sp.]|jgi:hypothetical protein|nr:YqaJ viral recombinase family protein [Treponema sp.]